ncbi:MAG: site-specific tyrosine recombinase XerD [Flavobacteriia bacterium]|nr:site-specific tyrosine recombinase XerD [Flavobacteriia bacterium]
MTWVLRIKEFISYIKIEKGLSDNTCFAYQQDLAKLVDFCVPRGLAVEEVRYEHLKEFVALLFDLGLSARSQARIISGVKQFFGFLLTEQILSRDPSEMLEQPKLGRKLPEVLDIEEIDALIAAVDVSKPEGHRNRAMLETLYSCGIRVSELVNLKLSDLFFDEGFVRVIGKGNKERLVPVSEKVEKELSFYLNHQRNKLSPGKGDENIVFLNRRGNRLTRVMIFTIIRQLAEAIGLKKTVSPHTFRHSFATHLLEGGANLRAIQEMLGHESITTTEIYTHLDQRFLREAILTYHPRNHQ